MTAASPAISPPPLVEKTERAIREGLQLLRWMSERRHEDAAFPLDLRKKYRLANRADGYFGSVEIDGVARTVMGCRQDIDFGALPGPDGPTILRDFVLGEFLSRAHWIYPDGAPGGFTVERSLYKTAAGAYGEFPPEDRAGCLDWRRLGVDYAWVMLTVHIHDFVMDFGPFRKRLKEAACVAAHPGFVSVDENPPEGGKIEVSIGYPFVDIAPIPNVFGFGPGKFGAAVKRFSFLLTREDRVRARLEFAAAPRCRKVFDFGTRWPDPIYGGAALLGRLTLGAWNPQPFHNRLDAGMLAQHCRVHQALMDGSERIWSDWLHKTKADART